MTMISVASYAGTDAVLIHLRFFAEFNTPSYCVVAGTLKPGFYDDWQAQFDASHTASTSE